MADKQAEIKTAQEQVAQLEQTKKGLTIRLATAPQADKSKVQALINDINTRISGAKSALNKLVQAYDLVKQIPGGQQAINKAGEKIGNAIDNFLAKYGNKSFEIVRSPKFSLTFPTPIALIQISGSANIVLSGALKSARTGTTITSEATLSGSLNGSLAINIGAKIAGYQIGLEGGLNVSANATGKSVITLSAAGTDLSASMNPADVNINASAALYFKWGSLGSVADWAIHKGVDNFVLPYIKGASRSGNQINYPLGTIDLLIIKTPIYSLTFSITQARFALNKSGSYSCKIHPTLVSRFNALKKAVGL